MSKHSFCATDLCPTISSRVERHHDSTCSVHQAPSDVQVLCQHDLEMIGTSVLVNQCVRSRGHLERRHIRYLSSHFELDNSPHGGVSINSLDQSRVTVQSLKNTDWSWRRGGQFSSLSPNWDHRSHNTLITDHRIKVLCVSTGANSINTWKIPKIAPGSCFSLFSFVSSTSSLCVHNRVAKMPSLSIWW